MKYLILILPVLLLISCKSERKKKSYYETKIEEYNKTAYLNSMDSLGIIKYHLKDSEYIIKMRVSGLVKTNVKKAFSIKADTYSVPEKKDGYMLTVQFEVANPYEKELMIPIPDYFGLTTNNDKSFAKKTVYSKSCARHIINTTNITDDLNQRLYELTKEKCNNKYCILFKPLESKQFRIHFDEAIIESESIVALLGFNLFWNDPNCTYKKDVGIVIDTEKEQILGTRKM
ncbi:hypothetical protein [Saccharicrinis aurantiacus]|uniref:hypothetical protein n=1 Tax=Saccharicrinis aurantiacus TaxID=1849719 RepID=UPI00094F9629|nr:hypothetical protein [Saccharicrinis aurantiacus]